MCKVSNKLKLCTCKTKTVEQLKHYWILKRPTERTHWIIGEMILPVNIGKDADKLNQKTILKQLNKGDIFDIELQHQESDILELHFTFKADSEKRLLLPCYGDYLAYAFKVKGGVWKIVEYNPYEIDFDVVKKGKILNSFSKT
jgi:hypothetical protein